MLIWSAPTVTEEGLPPLTGHHHAYRWSHADDNAATRSRRSISP
jgi:hypothetical protein